MNAFLGPFLSHPTQECQTDVYDGDKQLSTCEIQQIKSIVLRVSPTPIFIHRKGAVSETQLVHVCVTTEEGVVQACFQFLNCTAVAYRLRLYFV